jgi:histidyl-tRNA synthetase
MKNIIQPVKGTREFYPPEMAIRNWLYENIRKVSESFGYSEYDGPFLEPIDLYAAKSGEELVKEQSFVFPDRGGNLITLRPELTPSLARMIAQKQRQLIYPLRWWAFGPFWRYEKPQKGRTREFFQWNIDLIGSESPEADAELIAICAEFFKRIGLSPENVKVQINDRRLMDRKLSEIGIDASLKKKALNIIDHQDKMNHEVWKAYAIDKGMTEEQFNGLKKILENYDLYQESSELINIFNALENLGVKEYVQFDPKIVRGLDYYTGVVFEARDIGKSTRAILGGGRYDDLVKDVGGEPLTGVGFAMGDVVLPIILEQYGLLPDLLINPTQILVTIFDEESMSVSLSTATALRKAGFSVQTYPEVAKIGKQLKYADRTAVQFALIVGPEEKEQGIVQIKDMRTREQSSVPMNGLIDYLKGLLAE